MAELKLPFPFPKDIRELTANQDMIRQLVADLDSKVQEFTNLKVGTIEATTGDITTLGTTTGNITTVNSTTGNVTTVNSTTGNVTTVNSTTGNVTTVNSTLIDTDTVDSTTGNITTVNSTLIDTDTVDSTTGNITTVNSTTGNITTVNSTLVDSDTVDTFSVDTDSLEVTDTINTSGGRVSQPKQPAFLVRTAAQLADVAGDDNYYTIIWDTETQDVANNFDITTGIFTAPTAGTYYFDTSVQVSDAEVGSAPASSRLRMTFSGGLVIEEHMFSAGLNQAIGRISGMFPLAASETVYVSVNTIRGADLDDLTKDSNVDAGSYFSGSLIN